MLLHHLSSSFGSVALFLVFSFQATTSASPIDSSWLSDVSPNALTKRVPPRQVIEQRECSNIFGSPIVSDCANAIRMMPEEQIATSRQFYNIGTDINVQFINEFVPRFYDSGSCTIQITTMKHIKDGHFGFIVGDLPVGTSDVATWAQIKTVSGQLNSYCVANPPQGKNQGGIQRAGNRLDLAVVIFGQGLYSQYLSELLGHDFGAGVPGPVRPPTA